MEKIAVMSAAFYPKPEGVRFELQCEQIRLAREQGWSIFVSSGQHDETNDVLRKLGAVVVVQDGRPHGAERRRLANKAIGRGASFGLWMEEKPYLLRHLPMAIERMREKGAGALLFNRSEASWPSWPTLQRATEPACNLLYNSLFGAESETFDPMLGPALFDRWGLEDYATCDPTVYGVTDVYPNLVAPLAIRAKGGYVTSFEVDLEYPPAQRAEEEGDPGMARKRLTQVAYVTAAWEGALKLHGASLK